MNPEPAAAGHYEVVEIDQAVTESLVFELVGRAFCARYFPGRRRRYDLEAVVAYGASAAPLMRKLASNREHSTTSAAVT